MKSEVLSYVIAAAIMAVVMGLGLSIPLNVEVAAVLGWATVGVLLGMVAIEYRRSSKHLSGRA